MHENGARHDSNGIARTTGGRAEPAAPDRVRDLAEGCVRFVERALGVRLDYEPETLPVLDHYLEQARKDASTRPEALAVVAHAAGAYLGEVVRGRHASWWRAEGDDPGAWRVELEAVFLSFSPVELVADALQRGRDASVEDDPGEQLEIDDADREAVTARLAELPAVSEEEFYAPSTRLEVIDIAVEAIRARRMAEGDEVGVVYAPSDYDD